MELKLEEEEVEAIVLAYAQKEFPAANFNRCSINTYSSSGYCKLTYEEDKSAEVPA